MHRGHFKKATRRRRVKKRDAELHAFFEEVEGSDFSLSCQDSDEQDVLSFMHMADNISASLLRQHATEHLYGEDYQFGYSVCEHCHNDQVYYLHREKLHAGYTFRCRVCNLEMTITAKVTESSSMS